ncbi:hypothetical protein R3P38DRAFT_3091566 [Favolaschia claudopus]|uniref:Uncharacterized protein n=1 Tax=Favolaschia claudopus TaxID=2862362 RepID=A0AAV9ZRR6_9AGAR
MPESQALQIFAARVRKACLKAFLNCGILAEGVLHIFPRTWAEGTAAKAYSTFTMKQGAPGRYLLETERKSGPIHVAVRGKCLAISAGHARSPFFYPFHILVCHFGLEGEILTPVPGNNPNAAKAERLRSFLRMEESYVQVYRKEEVRVPAALYDLYQSRGLLDPNHTIGTPYHGQWVPTDKKYKLLPVRFFEGGANTGIMLSWPCPRQRGRLTSFQPCTFKDVTQAGYATTLGPASFREPMRNKLDPEAIANLCSGKADGQERVRTGERGRPRKPLTIATVKRIADIPRSAKRVKEDKENIDPVDQGEEELAPTRRYNTRSRMP